MTYNLGRVLTQPMTVNELAAKLNADPLDKPNLRTAPNSAVKSNLATKTQRRIGGRMTWVYKWRM